MDEGLAEQIMRGRILRAYADGFPQHPFRIGELVLLQISLAQQDVWSAEIRIRPHSPFEKRDGPLPVLPRIGAAQLVVDYRVVGVDGPFPLKLPDAAIDIASINQPLAEQVVRPGDAESRSRARCNSFIARSSNSSRTIVRGEPSYDALHLMEMDTALILQTLERPAEAALWQKRAEDLRFA